MGLPEYERIANTVRKSGPARSANIASIEESAATEEVTALYDSFRTHFGRQDVPGILKCFATHPPLLKHMMDLSESLIFAEGALTRKHKEMIATLISEQNLCPYCADSHGYFMCIHGASPQALLAIQSNNLHSSALSAPEHALLEFARKVNLNSHEIDHADVEKVKQAGWNELQIAEAVHVAALFATFNRVANAFGLKSQGLLALFDEGDGAGHSNATVSQGGYE
jgi:uncharacterized peroxidase-related enzyme